MQDPFLGNHPLTNSRFLLENTKTRKTPRTTHTPTMSSSVQTYPMTNAAEKSRLESITNHEAPARVETWENYDQSFHTYEGDPIERQQTVQEQDF